MAEAPTPKQLVAELCAEQRRRWQDGERVSAAAYLEQHPSLADDPVGVVELVYNEVQLREEHGETPSSRSTSSSSRNTACRCGCCLKSTRPSARKRCFPARRTVRLGPLDLTP